ncbi:MAG TPA: hypothetical protein VHM19_19715 [Polyangiales bacterium]|jgi:hypothetical protein|nr:hypothetical protein [Polyangiales bacterium]
MSGVAKPDLATLAKIRELTERVLSREEYEALAAIPIGDEERAERLALIAWFTRRYPTPAERLAYARRAHAAWLRNGA